MSKIDEIILKQLKKRKQVNIEANYILTKTLVKLQELNSLIDEFEGINELEVNLNNN